MLNPTRGTLLLLALGACSPEVKKTSAPPEVVITLTQRPDMDPGCTLSVPARPNVFTGQPFAFQNNTPATIQIVQNNGNLFFAKVPSGTLSHSMMIEKAQGYGYFTFAPDIRTIPGRPCRVNYVEVVDRSSGRNSSETLLAR